MFACAAEFFETNYSLFEFFKFRIIFGLWRRVIFFQKTKLQTRFCTMCNKISDSPQKVFAKGVGIFWSLKLPFFEKSSKVPLDTQNAFSTTRPRDFCQNSVKNESTIVSEKNILFSQKVPPDMLNTFLATLMELFRHKCPKVWEKVRKWVWVYDFSSKICNLIQNIFLHTQKFTTVLHLCQRLFVASSKFCCT